MLPIPTDVVPIIEAWRTNLSFTERLYVPDLRAGSPQGRSRASPGAELPEMADSSDRGQIGNSAKAGDLSGHAPTLGTDMQVHRAMKDTQQILRHASIRATADV
jgi:hypothetical protein